MPPELSPIYASMRNPSLVDFPGRLAAVFFVTGCNFRCGFCHNAPLLGSVKEGYSWDRLDELCQKFRRQWVKAVVITGGEPSLAANLVETLHFFRERGFEVKLDTNGSRPSVLAHALSLVSFVAMDVKCSLPRYGDFVGFADSGAIHDSIRLLLGSTTSYEFRTTLIEAIHTEEEVSAIGETVRGAMCFAVQPFIPRQDLPEPELRVTPRTRPQFIRRAADILRPYVRRVEVRGG
jgi:pyruvate formate lyase activating enzyme